MHPISPYGLLVLPLVVIFVIWRIFGRMRRSANLWFKPHGADFLYHPRGRWGRAYVVTAAMRAHIERRTSVGLGLVGAVVSLAYLAPLTLLATDPETYQRLRGEVLLARLATLILAVGIMWLYHHLAIRPLYAAAPPAPERMTMDDARRNLADRTSWALLAFRFVLFGAAFVLMIGLEMRPPPGGSGPLYIVFALACVLFLFQTARLALIKSGRW